MDDFTSTLSHDFAESLNPYTSPILEAYIFNLIWLVVSPYPTEKCESQLGSFFPTHEKLKSHVPNHQSNKYHQSLRFSPVDYHIHNSHIPIIVVYVSDILDWNNHRSSYLINLILCWYILILPISILDITFFLFAWIFARCLAGRSRWAGVANSHLTQDHNSSAFGTRRLKRRQNINIYMYIICTCDM